MPVMLGCMQVMSVSTAEKLESMLEMWDCTLGWWGSMLETWDCMPGKLDCTEGWWDCMQGRLDCRQD